MTTAPRWLSLGVAALLLATGIALPLAAILVPLRADYAATTARIADANLAFDRYQKIAEQLPRQRATLSALKEPRGRQDGFLAGGNETLIGAELQNRVKTVVESAQGQLRSTQVLAPRDDDGFRLIAIRAEMTGELSAVQAIFYQLEASSPLLFLDNVDLRIHPVDRRDGSDDVPPLDVSFEVYGYAGAQR